MISSPGWFDDTELGFNPITAVLFSPVAIAVGVYFLLWHEPRRSRSRRRRR